MNTTNETTGGIMVSSPAHSAGMVKKNDNRRNDAIKRDATAAGMFAFFQNSPRVSGAKAPANMMSKASTR